MSDAIQTAIKERRFKLLRCEEHEILSLLRLSKEWPPRYLQFSRFPGIPEDAYIYRCGSQFNPPCIEFLLVHPSFDQTDMACYGVPNVSRIETSLVTLPEWITQYAIDLANGRWNPDEDAVQLFNFIQVIFDSENGPFGKAEATMLMRTQRRLEEARRIGEAVKKAISGLHAEFRDDSIELFARIEKHLVSLREFEQ